MATRTRTVRLSISLPVDVVDWLDRHAESDNVTRSGYLMRMILERKGATAAARRRGKVATEDWRPADAAK